MSSEPGRLEWERSDPEVVALKLVGEHDASTAQDLEKALLSATAEGWAVVVDLTETTFVDSSVVNALIQGRRHAERPIVLEVATESIVHKVLEVTALTDLIPTRSTRTDAIAAARAALLEPPI